MKSVWAMMARGYDMRIKNFLRKHGSKLFIIIAILVLAIVILNGQLFFYTLNEQAAVLSREQLEIISSKLQETLNTAQVSLFKVSSEVAVLTGTGAEDEKIVAALRQHKSELADENCINVFAARGDLCLIPDRVIGEDLSVRDRIWYKGAEKSGVDVVYVSSPYVDYFTGETCFSVSMLLKDGKTIVGLDYDLTDMQACVEYIDKSMNGDALIVNSEGMIVSYGDASLVGQNLSDALPDYSGILQKILASGENTASFTSRIEGVKSTIFYTKTDNDWYLISTVSNAGLYKSNYKSLMRNLILNVLLIGVLIFLYIITHRRQTQVEKTLIAEEKFLDKKTEDVSHKLHAILKHSSESRLDNVDMEEAMRLIQENAYGIENVMNEISLSAKVIETVQEENNLDNQKVTAGMSGRRSRLFLVGVLVVLFFAFIVSIIVATTSTVRSGGDSMMGHIGARVDELKVWTTHQETILDMLSNFVLTGDNSSDNKANEEMISLVSGQYDQIYAVYLANANSSTPLVISDGKKSASDEKVEELKWYTDAMDTKGNEGFTVSSPFYREEENDYFITLSKKIMDDEGEFYGVIAMDVYLSSLTDIIDNNTDTAYTFFVDKDGNIISHPNKDYSIKKDSATSMEQAGYLEAVYTDDPVTLKDYDGKRKVVMSVVEEESGFSVVYVRKWSDIYGDVIKYDILFVVLFGLCMGVISYIMLAMIKWQEKATLVLQEAVEAATQADEAKSQFLAQMSHEIRTPINAVLGMDEMILRESNNESVRSYARDIQSAGNSLLSIINDILDISKIESGKLEIVPAEYELDSMLRDLVNMVSFRANAKNLKLEVTVDPSLPSKLYGDDVRVKQCITNILTNATKYTQTGTVWFRVSGTVKDQTCELYVEIEDTGIGIKEEDLSKLFSAFDRIEEKRNRNIEGTGLGMNITQNLLHLMGTKLEVESKYGEGSKFYFTIEQEIRDKTPIGVFDANEKEGETYDYNESFYAPNARVLVVDDNALNRKVFIALLKDTGVQITEAESGKECLELTEKNYYDIIFLDHMMPELDGIETLHLMKKNLQGPNKNTPVFVLTANAVTGAKEMYLSEGFNGFLSKPVVASKLEEVIKENISPRLFEHAPDKGEREKKEKLAKAKEEDLGELPIIGGIDWNYAMAHLYQKDLVIATVKDFVEMIPMHAKKLDEMYGRIDESGEMDNYRIQVHSMKSVAATLGIIPLAGMANVLENAAREGKKDTIEKMHSILIDYWYNYGEKLREAFNIEKTEITREEYDIFSVTDQLEKLKESMEDLDIDTADPIADYLYKYNWGDEMNEKVRDLKNAVTALDSDTVAELVDEILAAKDE